MPKHWTETLVELFDASGMSAEALSEASGVGLKSVYNYLNAGRTGKRRTAAPQGDTLVRLATALGTSERYLRFRDEEPPHIGLKKVPLLTMNEIGTLKQGQSVQDVWDGVGFVSAPETVSSKAFGIKVTDNANESRIHQGDIVILEPELAPEPGSYVVAVVEGHRGALLRRYRSVDYSDPATFVLMAENADFPPVKVDSEHPGFVVGRAVKRITDM